MTRRCHPSPPVGQAYSRRSPPLVVRPQGSSRRCHLPGRMLSNLPTKEARSTLSLNSRGITSLLLPSNLNRSWQRRLPSKRPQSKLRSRHNNNNKRSHKNHWSPLNSSNSPPDRPTDPLAAKIVSRRLPGILSSQKVNSSKRKLRCTSELKSVNSLGARDTESHLELKWRRPMRETFLQSIKSLRRSKRKLKLTLKDSLKSMV